MVAAAAVWPPDQDTNNTDVKLTKYLIKLDPAMRHTQTHTHLCESKQ